MGRARARAWAWACRLREKPLALAVIALLIATGTSLAMAEFAGIDRVSAAAGRAELEWLAVIVVARIASYGGYTAAHRATLTPSHRERPPADTTMKTVAYGAAATSVDGGFALDRRVLRGAGAGRHEATVRVLNLGAIELATLAPAAWLCALLLLGTPGVQASATLPWAVGVPAGAAAAVGLFALLGGRPRSQHGVVSRALARVLDTLALLRGQIRHPLRHCAAWLGMAAYWAGEMLSLWAALRAFGLDTPVPVVVLAYATGHVLTPRTLPLSGVGVTEVLLPLALLWLGVPLAVAVIAVFAYRGALLVLSLPPALLAGAEVRRLATEA